MALEVHSVAFEVHSVALEVHSVALEVHMVVLEVHMVALEVHSVESQKEQKRPHCMLCHESEVLGVQEEARLVYFHVH